VGPGQPEHSVDPHARAAARLSALIDATPAADLAGWEPAYGRLAEAQVKWEAAHGRPLAAP
jgi:tRNA threonylcarbamoyladenosine biosynthesis protein TsaB